MGKKTIDDIKGELQDKVNTLVRDRSNLILNLDKKNRELEQALDNLYSIDDTKVRITCIVCKGLGYVAGDDGKKHTCQTCNGRMYLWTERYIEPNVINESGK